MLSPHIKHALLLLPLLTLAARGAELFVPDLFYARVPDPAAFGNLITISIDGEEVEGLPGTCALSVRPAEDDTCFVIEYVVAIASGEAPCSVRLSCMVVPEKIEAVAPGVSDPAGSPAPDAAARLRPALEALDPRLGEAPLLLEKTKTYFLATLEAPPRHAMRDGGFVPLDVASEVGEEADPIAEEVGERNKPEGVLHTENAECEPHAKNTEISGESQMTSEAN